jgi:hypothetical protein
MDDTQTSAWLAKAKILKLGLNIVLRKYHCGESLAMGLVFSFKHDVVIRTAPIYII